MSFSGTVGTCPREILTTVVSYSAVLSKMVKLTELSIKMSLTPVSNKTFSNKVREEGSEKAGKRLNARVVPTNLDDSASSGH